MGHLLNKKASSRPTLLVTTGELVPLVAWLCLCLSCCLYECAYVHTCVLLKTKGRKEVLMDGRVNEGKALKFGGMSQLKNLIRK